MTAKRYCAYKHYADGKLFYVGAGLIGRALNISARSDRWKKIYDPCESFAVEICQKFETKEEALILEGDLIEEFYPTANFNCSNFVSDGGVFSKDYLNLPSNYADVITGLEKKISNLEDEIESFGEFDDAEDLIIEARDNIDIALKDIAKILRPYSEGNS